MTITDTGVERDISFSDNSHIFGIPFVIHQLEHTLMRINRDDLREWIDRVEFLQNAGLEFCFNYRSKE